MSLSNSLISLLLNILVLTFSFIRIPPKIACGQMASFFRLSIYIYYFFFHINKKKKWPIDHRPLKPLQSLGFSVATFVLKLAKSPLLFRIFGHIFRIFVKRKGIGHIQLAKPHFSFL